MKELSKASEEEVKLEKREQGAYDFDKHTEFLQDEKEKRLATFSRLSSQKIIYDPVYVHRFIVTINRIAKKNNLFDKIPREPFPSILDFGKHMVEFFFKNNVSMEDIRLIDEAILALETNKVNE